MKKLSFAAATILALGLNPALHAAPSTCKLYHASIRPLFSHPEASLEVTLIVRQGNWNDQTGYGTQTVDVSGAYNFHCTGSVDFKDQVVCGWAIDEISEATPCQ